MAASIRFGFNSSEPQVTSARIPTTTRAELAAGPVKARHEVSKAAGSLTRCLSRSLVWTPISTNTADGNGVVSFSDLMTTNLSQRFYRIKPLLP
jgi:hypothetical protein